jgi:hypothetical protein
MNDIFGTIRVPVKGADIVVRVENIDPDRAAKLLACNGKNRPISPRIVDQLSADIEEDAFEFNGDTICLSSEGILLDGQHRLSAIIQSGRAVPCIVVYGLDPTVSDTIDQGKPRSVKDILALSYGIRPDNAGLIVGIATVLAPESVRKSRPKLAESVFSTHQELAPWATWAKAVSSNSVRVPAPSNRRSLVSGMQPSPIGALAVHMVRQGADADLVRQFFEQISSGMFSDADQGTVITALRKRQQSGAPLINNGGTPTPLFLEFATYINAYARYVSYEPVGKIQAPRGRFSTLNDLPSVVQAR